MPLRLSTVILVALCAVLAGCSTVSHTLLNVAGLQTIDSANAKIAAVQAQEAIKFADFEAKKEAQRKIEADVAHQQLQEASDHVYLALITYQLDPSPSNFESLMNAEDQAAATTLLPPRASTFATGITRMKAILADKDKQTQAMAAEVKVAQSKADQLASQKAAAEQQIVSIKQQEDQLKQADTQQIAQIQQAKDVATKQVLAKNEEIINNKAFTDDLKKKLTIGAGVLAVLAIAGAIFSPLLKRQFIEFAAVLGFVAVAIPYVTPQIVGIIFVIGLVAVLISIFCEHKDVAASVLSPTPAASPVVSTPTTASIAAPSLATSITSPITTSTPVATS